MPVQTAVDLEIQGQLQPGHLDRAIAVLADRQHRVVARRQLTDLGMGAGAIEHRLRLGRLYLVHRGGTRSASSSSATSGL